MVGADGGKTERGICTRIERKKIMQKRIVLTAETGKILTDGETFARVVYLAVDDEGENWREVDAPQESEEIE